MEELVKAVLASAEDIMNKGIDRMEKELIRIRANKANPSMIDSVKVDYYGSMVPLSQVANVSLIDARTIGISPWEKKMTGAIEKAIRDSDLGLNPASQGDMIRIPMPPLTEERRRELVKVVKSEAEDARIAVRNLRRDANSALKDMLKEKSVSEDDERKAQDDVQKLTDRFIGEIEKLIQAKEIELLAV